MAATMAGIHVDNTFAESGPEASNSASSVQPDLIEGIETANSTQPDPIEETENADPQPVVTEGVKDANTHATL